MPWRFGIAIVMSTAFLAAAPHLIRAAAQDAPAILGLDHIPVAVSDLDAAAAGYRAFGFALKPGTFHANGIRNQHVKFHDGTELELITAPEARDPLTTTYRRHLERGDGPAFVAFYAPAMDRAASILDAAKLPYRRDGRTLDFPDATGLGYVFLGPRNESPTDRPEHFAHPNGAESLVAASIFLPPVDHARNLDRAQARSKEMSELRQAFRWIAWSIPAMPFLPHGLDLAAYVVFLGPRLLP